MRANDRYLRPVIPDEENPITGIGDGCARARQNIQRVSVFARSSRCGARTRCRCRAHRAHVRSRAAREIGLQIQLLNASTSREIDAAFETFVDKRPDALFVAGDPLFTNRRVQLATLAARYACRSRRTDELRKQSCGIFTCRECG